MVQVLKNSVLEKVIHQQNHLYFVDVTLIGVSPEAEISYPRINPAQRKDNELTNGHTHFFLIGDDNKKFEWGDETKLKFDLSQR